VIPDDPAPVASLNVQDIPHLPLEQLAALGLRRLQDSATFERAGRSLLYRDKWSAAGIRPGDIRTYDDLARVPYLTSRELRAAMNDGPLEDILCSPDVAHWFATTGTTGMPKWIPYGRRDIDVFMEIRDRCATMLPPADGTRGFGVTAPAPFVEDGLGAFEMIRRMSSGSPGEGVAVSLTEVEHEEAVSFALDLKPHIIAAFPGFAARMAEIIEERAPEVARRELQRARTPRNLAAYLVTRVRRIRPRDLSRYSWGLFGGEPLDPYRAVLRERYGLEAYDMYLFTEFLYPAIECGQHDGMHVWMDICVPEIIPQSELELESRDDAHIPRAVPLWEAERGLRGEYVLTTFGEVLPLVRYRFGDLVEIVGTEPCRCGITHPRIKVPRRSDGTICLGAVRFPATQLDEILLRPSEHGQVRRWQLEITREGYRPKPILRVEPVDGVVDSAAFLGEIGGRLEELEILRIGIENRMVAQPVVSLAARITDDGRRVTEAGRVIDEGDKR
jgi:phenylacetate-CoA ligase